MKEDTIAAITTAMKNAGISLIRISGNEALEVADHVFKPGRGEKKVSEMKSHTLHYGYIMEGEDVIDEVLLSVMKSPKTYTKEDVVEINCHGGVVVTRRVLELVLRNGARLAEPGEFTKRAFLNGRIDLSQAEAVIDVINAENSLALSSSISQLRGNILAKIKDIRKAIIKDTAFIEAALDDPEHIEMDGFSEKLKYNIIKYSLDLEKLLESTDKGKILKEGIKTVILGKPNAGKSSVLNALLREERAIVTEIEGTTRDTLEESIDLGDFTLLLCDTAGIRKTKDLIENIGVERAKAAAENADLILYVVDGSRPPDENDIEIIKMIQNKKVLVLVNKRDLEKKVDNSYFNQFKQENVVEISAKCQTGIECLEERIKELFFHGEVNWNDQIFITNERHKEAIKEAIESLKEVLISIEAEMPEDFYSIDLLNAYQKLGEIIGEAVDEDLVNTIFSKFCMGK